MRWYGINSEVYKEPNAFEVQLKWLTIIVGEVFSVRRYSIRVVCAVVICGALSNHLIAEDLPRVNTPNPQVDNRSYLIDQPVNINGLIVASSGVLELTSDGQNARVTLKGGTVLTSGSNCKIRSVLVQSNDLDGDGLSSDQELSLGSDPSLVDSDGDGVPDGLDVDPLDSSRFVLPKTDGDVTPPVIFIDLPQSVTGVVIK